MFGIFKSGSEKAQEYYNVALKYQKNKYYAEAQNHYSKAILEEPLNPHYWNALAWLMFEADSVTELSLDIANTACLLSNYSNYTILDTKASIQYKLQLTNCAIKTWKQCILQGGANDKECVNRYSKALSTVFVSYMFNDLDSELASGLISVINDLFTIFTGEGYELGDLRNKVNKRLNTAVFFVAIITKGPQKSNSQYSVSNWILSEIASAIALNKEVVLMVEDGVDKDEIKCIQGNLEIVTFNRNSFTKCCSKIKNALIKRKNILLDWKMKDL